MSGYAAEPLQLPIEVRFLLSLGTSAHARLPSSLQLVIARQDKAWCCVVDLKQVWTSEEASGSIVLLTC